MPSPDLQALIELSEKASLPGELFVSSIDRPGVCIRSGMQPVAEMWWTGLSREDMQANAQFIAALVNWFRANHSTLTAPTLPGAGGGEWLPIESAPEDGTPVLIAAIEDGQLFDVLHGHFEVLAEDEDDGPWDIRDGEPWCSYEGRPAGIYFCHWLPEKEWESRWKFGPNSGYTHWRAEPKQAAPPQQGG